ncbi:hypothetical protein SDC9_21224 [bioreactor metagenome]|uniref:Uncharacterized protein n=1 Tax=bioreactor metagenome TaxID=1076179 RepID=A0A644U8Z8_9ZZZZ|nr:hypothetical protein [Methanobrevibacter sp.]MEA4957984.1 hypothetical protein [Methanobrevibacter sp.]
MALVMNVEFISGKIRIMMSILFGNGIDYRIIHKIGYIVLKFDLLFKEKKLKSLFS